MDQSLTSQKYVKRLLGEFGRVPSRSLGQHFLVSDQILQELVTAACLDKEDIVIEPGAGVGTVTVELARRAGYVLAYELDTRLVPLLKHNLGSFLMPEVLARVEIWAEDVLVAFRRGAFYPQDDSLGSQLPKVKVVGSIPYSITSPLIHEIVYHHQRIKQAALIIQDEVAKRMTSLPPRGSYLSTFVSLFAQTRVVRKRIAPANFWPPPEVRSAIIVLDLESQRQDLANRIKPREWSRFLHRGFAQPRKMLSAVFGRSLLLKAGISPHRRAQELSLEEWLELYRVVKEVSGALL